jgi:protein-tyrosine-phosphatase/DNA-binding transcriptional ArsR family regulator
MNTASSTEEQHRLGVDERRFERARALGALGDPTRLAIVDLLMAQDLTPDSLIEALGIPGNLLAHHLKSLQSAGLITRRKSQHDRRRMYVHLMRASLEGLLPSPAAITVPRVVFVCTHNSARSVLAEAIWATMSEVPGTSAGTHPASRINPKAKAAARRAGLRITRPLPQSVLSVLRPDDLVVSVCDAVNEELGPLANPRLHWSIPDPAGIGTDEAFTAAVIDITERTAQLAPRVATTTELTHPIAANTRPTTRRKNQ